MEPTTETLQSAVTALTGLNGLLELFRPGKNPFDQVSSTSGRKDLFSSLSAIFGEDFKL